MDNVIKFPDKAVRKFGFERAKKKKRSKNKMELLGQLNLFSKLPGQILRLPTGIGPFEEALLLDERGEGRAAESYRRAISEGDCVADAYCNLGIMESERGKSGKAFDCFTKAITHEPRHFESHYNLANLYFDLGDLRLARGHYKNTTELEPNFPNVYFNLGLVDAMEGNYEAAITALVRYKGLAPEDKDSKADELLQSLKRSITNKH